MLTKLENETIEKAAIRFRDIVVFVERPGKHHTIIHELAYLGLKTPINTEDDGFLTSTGRFVDRIEAAKIALNAGQIEKLSVPPNLYSEDLW